MIKFVCLFLLSVCCSALAVDIEAIRAIVDTSQHEQAMQLGNTALADTSLKVEEKDAVRVVLAYSLVLEKKYDDAIEMVDQTIPHPLSNETI